MSLVKTMEKPTVPQPAAAPVKKPSRTRSSNPPSHPKYSEMINFAVKALKQRKGSSRQAILKYVTTNYQVGDSASKYLTRNLRSMVEKEELVVASGSGANGRFKVVQKAKVPRASAGAKRRAVTKKPKKASPKKKKPAARKSPKKKRKSPVKKRVAKKSPKKKVVRKVAKKSLKKTTIKKKARK